MPRSMHSFDPCHLNIRRGRRPRKKGCCQPGGRAQPLHRLRNRLHHVRRIDDTQMIVRHQRDRPPPLSGCILQYHCPGLRNRDRRARHNTVERIEFHGAHSLIHHKLKPRRQPLGRETGWNHHPPLPASGYHPRHNSSNVRPSYPRYMSVIIPQPVFEHLQRCTRILRGLPAIQPNDLAPTRPRGIRIRSAALRQPDSPQDLGSRRCRGRYRLSFHASPASPTSPGKSPSASPVDLSPGSTRRAFPAAS